MVDIKYLKNGEDKGSDRTSDRTSVIFIGEAFLVPTFRYLPSSVGQWSYTLKCKIGNVRVQQHNQSYIWSKLHIILLYFSIDEKLETL